MTISVLDTFRSTAKKLGIDHIDVDSKNYVQTKSFIYWALVLFQQVESNLAEFTNSAEFKRPLGDAITAIQQECPQNNPQLIKALSEFKEHVEASTQ